jgi:signal transduction histidine kinase
MAQLVQPRLDPEHSLLSTPVSERFEEARIFVVDDHPANIALMVGILDHAGYRNVFTEMDSRNVSGRLPEVDPDLVILDLLMPHLDGFAVLRHIRRFAPREVLPVLVLTADTTPAFSERALATGAQDFMLKPFSSGEVLVRSRNLLRTRLLYTTLLQSILGERDAALSARLLAGELTSERHSADRLRVLDGVKDTLLQTVSHDLRDPIWAVLMMSDLLAADAEGTAILSAEMRSSYIGKVIRSVLQMQCLLSDILDSDPARAIDGYSHDCNVGDVVRRVLSDADLVPDHPLYSEITDVDARIDPAHLERIVVNLLNNAQQHLAPGVPIWVKVARHGEGVIVSIEDGGTGVPPELRAQIFEPFRHGATSSATSLGLGLSLVSRFATLHGGRAWLEDRKGGGACFRVFIPSSPHRNNVSKTAAGRLAAQHG